MGDDDLIDVSGIPVGAVLGITWGDPPEEVTAVVHHWTQDGVFLSPVHDLTQLDGYVWLGAGAVRDIVVLAGDDPAVRHLRAVGVRRDAEQVEHDSLTAVLTALQTGGDLVFVQDTEDGSDAGSVGRVLRIDDETATFSDIGTDGRETGQELVRRLDEIDRLEWGDTYTRALAVLNGLEDA